jgi:hypothetical protein
MRSSSHVSKLLSLSTANYSARYILNQASGPFLSELTAHCNITISCISYLSTSLSLIDPGCTPEEIRICVLQGYHSLHHYADKFWIDHLLQYFKLRGEFENPILVALEKLLPFQEYSVLQGNDRELDKGTLPSSVTDRMELLSRMSDIPEIRLFIRKLLILRAESPLDKVTGESRKGDESCIPENMIYF